MRCYLVSMSVLLGLSMTAFGQELYGPRISPYSYTNPMFGLPNNLSPYLNLFRGGNPAVNYYLGVVAERDRRLLEQEVDQALSSLPRDTTSRGFSIEDPLALAPLFRPLPRTGHAAGFMQYGTYYNFPRYSNYGQQQQRRYP